MDCNNTRLLEVLLDLKADIATLKGDVKSLKDTDLATAQYLKDEVKPLIVDRSHRKWLGSTVHLMVMTVGSLLGVMLTAGKLLGY